MNIRLDWYKHCNKNTWFEMLKKEKFDETFLREHIDLIEFHDVVRQMVNYQKVSFEFIREFKDIIEWGTFNYRLFKNDKQVEEFADKVDFITLSRQPIKLSEQFFDKYKERFDWTVLLKHNKFSMDFLRDHLDYLDWDEVAYDQDLDMDFIEEFADKLDWHLMSATQKFTPDIMNQFFDRIDWQQFEAYNKDVPIPWPIYKRVAKLGLWDPYNRQDFNFIR